MQALIFTLFVALSLPSLVWAAGADIVPDEPEPTDDVEPAMPEAIRLSQEYIQALTSRNYNSINHFYNRETVFEDKTAHKKITGATDILTFLRRIHVYTLSYNFEPDHMFHSGSLVVMIGTYRYRSRGDLFGKPGKTIELAIPGVTTLKLDIADQKVERHTDLLDYDAMRDQLASQ